MSTNDLYEWHVTYPFFPEGVTLSIQCDSSAVEMWAAMLPRLRALLEQAPMFDAPQPGSPGPIQVPSPAPIQVPEGIVLYAKSWNEDWVEADVLERAKRLFLEHGDWNVAYQKLLEQDGEAGGQGN